MQKPIERELLRAGSPCPICGKPLELGRARSLLTLFLKRYWLRCSGWPHCDFARLASNDAKPSEPQVDAGMAPAEIRKLSRTISHITNRNR
jgi:ssDNA-binding Zn-finger/Zn-ribbon topoisomerase 1